MIVTIDGPAGAGKSSVAKELARRLGFEFLDTGAMYRAVTLAALRATVDPDDDVRLADLLTNLHIEMAIGGHVILNGEDVTAQIRAAEVTTATSRIADSPIVRRFLGAQQRLLAEGRDMVCEGRDQGTIVFPHAISKFFLVADPQERARRRQRELALRGQALDWQFILDAQMQRDQRDAERGIAPLKPAVDALVIDTTHLSFEQVVDRLEQEVHRCRTA